MGWGKRKLPEINVTGRLARDFAIIVGDEVLAHTGGNRDKLEIARLLLEKYCEPDILTGVDNGVTLEKLFRANSEASLILDSYSKTHEDKLAHLMLETMTTWRDDADRAKLVRDIRDQADLLGTPMDVINGMFVVLFK